MDALTAVSENLLNTNIPARTLKLCPTEKQLLDNTQQFSRKKLVRDTKHVLIIMGLQYHCPIKSCKYFRRQFFKSIKLLKQHYRKVHMNKEYLCSTCSKGFSLKSALRRHIETCGVVYICTNCDSMYNSLEAILTHLKRKNHLTGLRYSNKKSALKIHTRLKEMTGEQFKSFLKEPGISPYRYHLVIDSELPSVVVDLITSRPKPKECNCKTKKTKETQTVVKLRKIMPKTSTQTQTMFGMQTLIHGNEGSSKSHKELSFNNYVSSGTQTSPQMKCGSVGVPQTTFGTQTEFNTMFDNYKNLVESTKGILENDDNVSLITSDDSVQFNTKIHFMQSLDPNLCSTCNVSLPSVETTSTSDTQTDENNLDAVLSEFLDHAWVDCLDNETQTVFEDYIDQLYTDTCTQTCDSVFDHLDFTDIETQTPWPLPSCNPKENDTL